MAAGCGVLNINSDGVCRISGRPDRVIVIIKHIELESRIGRPDANIPVEDRIPRATRRECDVLIRAAGGEAQGRGAG